MVHRPAKGAPASEKIHFLTMGTVVVGIVVVTFVLSGIGALLIVRQARLEYNDARTEMLKQLIEGTQEDIRNKSQADA